MTPDTRERPDTPVATANDHDDGASFNAEPRPSHNELTVGFTDVKNQHVTPQFILRRFTDGDEHVRVFDIINERFFTTNTKRITARTKYYDIPLELDEELTAQAIELGIDVDRLRVSAEPWFTAVESAAAPLIDRLIEDPQSIEVFSNAELHELGRFLSAQYFRTPAYRDSMTEMNEGMKKQLTQVFPGVPLAKHLERTETNAEDMIHMLKETTGWANMLGSMQWRVGRVPEDSTLNTSDNMMNPRAKYAVSYSRPRSLVGVDYWIALAPNTLLNLRPRPLDNYGQSGAKYRQDYDSWEANYANLVSCAHATNFVIGNGPVFSRYDCLKQLMRVDHARGRVALELGYDPGPKIIPPFWDDEIREMYGDLPPITGGLPLNQRPKPRYEHPIEQPK
ncbi:MAG: DUF4238 domain-containing protein [Chloroflexi bacterium]|nr:DUF4238 domain-containing protein [Chloroflexota bacterium]